MSNGSWAFLESNDTKVQELRHIASLAVSVQLALQRAMVKGGVSQKALAERLGVSPARVSQYLSANGRNLTLATLGKIASALGEDFEFIAVADIQKLKTAANLRRLEVNKPTIKCYTRPVVSSWQDVTANENRVLGNMAA